LKTGTDRRYKCGYVALGWEKDVVKGSKSSLFNYLTQTGHSCGINCLIQTEIHLSLFFAWRYKQVVSLPVGLSGRACQSGFIAFPAAAQPTHNTTNKKYLFF
jgi:hypothetical protein